MNFAFVVDAFTPFEGRAPVRSALSAIRLIKAGLAAMLAGAALASHAQDRTQIDVPVIDSVEMTYSAFDPTHALISEHALLTALQHVAERATQFPMKKERQEYFDYTKGLRVGIDTSAHLLNLHYESLRRHGRDAPIGTERTFSIAYTLTQSGDSAHIVLEFPKQAQDEVKSEILNVTPKLWDSDAIAADYQRIAAALQRPELPMNTMAQGEIEAKYKPDVVLANFDRMLGHMSVGVPTGPSTNNGAASTGVFVFTVDGKRLPLFLKVYAYHDTSKVQYQIQLPYTLKADGSIKGADAVRGFVSELQRIADN